MKIRRPLKCLGGMTVGALAATTLAPVPLAAAEYQYTLIPQDRMTAVDSGSESVNEQTNGPLELVLDGDDNTYWHTEWYPAKDPSERWFVIQLGDEPVDLGRISLTPRRSSNGSGRVGDYSLYAIATDTCSNAAFDGVSAVKTGSFGGEVADALTVREITLDAPVSANCVKVNYDSSWGGKASDETISPVEQIASLAEFNAYTAAEATTDPAPGNLEITVPEGALEITDGTLTVRTHPDFPQVVDYRLGNRQLAGQYGDALDSFQIDRVSEPVEVGTPTTTENSVTYPVTFTNIDGASLDVVIRITDGVLSYTLTNIVDPDKQLNHIAIPGLRLVSVAGSDAASTVYGAKMSVNRGSSGDRKYVVADSEDVAANPVWMAVAANSQLAAGFYSNAVGDNTSNLAGLETRFSTSGEQLYGRYTMEISTINGVKVGSVGPAEWTYRAGAIQLYDDGTGIGVDDDPVIEVKITGDVNSDSTVDWQDAAINTRDIMPGFVGMDDVKNLVIGRIPFNIVSQATHPFLRTLDETKHISLATDNLGQQALLKGYQAEGHDSAQGDYANHYNTRAGGYDDLQTLAEEGKQWNTTFGIHVNATESYSEAHVFGPELLYMPPRKAWGWMNQAYYMNNPRDLATGNVLDRLAELREQFPEDSNLNWLYWDVYYPSGWEGHRFASEIEQQGWRQSSEWADKLPLQNTWSHWANDENYGGSTNKGIQSQLVRFVENSYRDTWNPDPMLGNPNIVEFEGWTGHVDYNAFNLNVWERNLPAKFLQQSDIMTWQPGEITFENGTAVTSPLESIDGRTIPTNRTITFDGATVYDQGSYLLPWSDGGTERLYYWNPAGESATWELTDSWQGQSSVTLFKLTDTGREKVSELSVSNGSITLPATEEDVAYVVYPTSEVPAAKNPNWGQGTNIVDPGFFAQNLDAYTTSGDVSIALDDRRNSQAKLGAGQASLAQTISLEAGTYSMWAAVEIEPGKTRPVEVTVAGDSVTPAANQPGTDAEAVTSLTSSSALNSTASDQLRATYFQRVPVKFSTTGGDVTFSVHAGDGDAQVLVDDLRVVPQPQPQDPDPTDETIVFDDFEHVDTGYWPFVTGSTNAGGDARTQLAELHPPYSQSGWYGLTDNQMGVAVEGQKYIDNVLDGTWSLLAHQEKGGLILRTTEASVPMKTGHKYRVSFDYQAAYDNDYVMVLGTSAPNDGAWAESAVEAWPVGRARGEGWADANGVAGIGTQRFSQEFVVGDTNPAFIGFVKNGGSIQGDLAIDNFRVEDLGIYPLLALEVTEVDSDDASKVAFDGTTTVSVTEGSLTDVAHDVTVPEGWTVTRAEPTAPDTVSPGSNSVQKWIITAPVDAPAGEITFTATYINADGQKVTETKSITVDPANLPMRNPIDNENYVIADVSSEETQGSAAPNGRALAAIDGDPNTHWHTKWTGEAATYPHYITLQVTNFETCTINALEYTQRQTQANGRVKGYQIYVSTDGENWGDPVAEGELSESLAPQVIHFTQVKDGTYVKMVQTSSINGLDFGGAGEIRLGGICGNAAPEEPEEPDETSVTAITAGKRLVGTGTNVWGTVSGADAAGMTVTAEVLRDGQWTAIGEATANDDGFYFISLSSLNNAGDYQVRARVADAVSEPATLTRVARTNGDIAEVTLQGRLANAWGTVHSPARITTQVFLPGKGWSSSQVRDVEAGFYAIELTYGKFSAGTLRWRVVVDHEFGQREYLDVGTQKRLRQPSVNHVDAKAVNADTFVWGTVEPNATVQTQVMVNGSWSTSQVGRADGRGFYAVPLTYGKDQAGSYTYRVVATYPELGHIVTESFTLKRV